jgi:AcrR family transcriptional regulator
MATKTRTLSTAEDRRETVLETATKVFAARGFDGTPTIEVAKAAGISQAYLFRLYPTKDDLVIALVDRCNERVYDAFARAAARAKAEGEDVLPAMGSAYVELIADRDVLLLQLHGHAASVTKPAVRKAMRASFTRLYELIKRETGESDAKIGRFFQMGMALNVLGSLDGFELDADWARAMRSTDDGEEIC